MKKFMTTKYLYLLLLLILSSSTYGQNKKAEMMEKLDFLVGEWIGTTRIYENGKVTREGAAYEKISYDLEKNILVIELNTEFLQLHTIVLFSEEDQKYHYHRFAKSGAAVYPAELIDGQLVVMPNENTRFFFRSTPEGGFREYGERRIDGTWVKTFEDTFTNTQ
ncbi:hypothetical protein [Robiginitalea myxolifaciens]|nr:hypothetical protein [Robiginitalea myxolifaciens]